MISFIILTWNSVGFIEDCLQSVIDKCIAEDLSFEIFVVDNGSVDGTISILQLFENKYPENFNIRPGSIYSSKGCSWRDRTGGCVFCARLEEGVRFRDSKQIWSEIEMLQQKYGINSIWDIADDNLNNKEWFVGFVKEEPLDIHEIHPCLKECVEQLDEYFHGTRKEFTIKLQPQGTEFQKRVWNQLIKIPFGETASYKNVAEAICLLRVFVDILLK